MAKIIKLKTIKEVIPSDKTPDEMVKSFLSQDRIESDMGKFDRTVPLTLQKFRNYAEGLDNKSLTEKSVQITRSIDEINKGLIAYHYFVKTSKNPNPRPDEESAVIGKVVMAKGLLTCQLEELYSIMAERKI